MKKTAKKAKKNKSNELDVFTGSQVGALIESFEHKLDLIYENQDLMEGRIKKEMDVKIGSLRDDMDVKIGSLRDDMNGKIGSLRDDINGKIDSLRDDMNGKIGGLRDDMDKKFDLTFEHFSNIEDELTEIKMELKKLDKNKVDVKKFYLLEIKVERLEKRLKKLA